MKTAGSRHAPPPLLALVSFGVLALSTPADAQPNLTPHKLTVTKSGTGTGTVRSAAGGIDCGGKCDNGYSFGVPVTLEASSGTGAFVGWSGACQGIAACRLTMNASKSVNAKFEVPKLVVRKESPAQGFQVVSSKPGIDCGGQCRANYEAGTTITLEAKGGPANYFPKWQGTVLGPRYEIRLASPVVEVGLGVEETVLAISYVGIPPVFRVRETSQRCELERGPSGACRLALDQGRTYTLISEVGPCDWRFQGASGDCTRKEECSFKVLTGRQTTVNVARAR